MGSCRAGEVLVCDAMGKRYASVGGDVKLLQLQMAGAAGIVTDGAIRDLDIVRTYGLAFCAGPQSGGRPCGGHFSVRRKRGDRMRWRRRPTR